jgi:hypothetical protein
MHDDIPQITFWHDPRLIQTPLPFLSKVGNFKGRQVSGVVIGNGKVPLPLLPTPPSPLLSRRQRQTLSKKEMSKNVLNRKRANYIFCVSTVHNLRMKT